MPKNRCCSESSNESSNDCECKNCEKERYKKYFYEKNKRKNCSRKNKHGCNKHEHRCNKHEHRCNKHEHSCNKHEHCCKKDSCSKSYSERNSIDYCKNDCQDGKVILITIG